MNRVLLTGANGYVGSRLLLKLLKDNFEVFALSRLQNYSFEAHDQLHVISGDLLEGTIDFPQVDVAFYLVHSMKDSKHFPEVEAKCAQNFLDACNRSSVKQIVYLSGICNSKNPSKHLQSRLNVEEILKKSSIPVTILRAGIIVGSGSASFEIMRDLVEKIPIMIGPKWLKNTCTPISIKDVIEILSKVVLKQEYYNKTLDIACPDTLTFEQMLLDFAKLRGLKRWIINVPVLTPYLSSLWLTLVTSVNFNLSKQLVESMRCDLVAQNRMEHNYLTFQQALERAFTKIEENAVISRWCDDWNIKKISKDLHKYVQVPTAGCFTNTTKMDVHCPIEQLKKRIFSIGGKVGWYYWNWAWILRGIFDKLIGGVGLRRGRKNAKTVKAGEALDFWRVLLADEKQGRLLLFAEMKLPGEAWLEFHIETDEQKPILIQTATFRPRGIFGRLYWYALYPFHQRIFKGMARKLCERGDLNPHEPKPTTPSR